MIGRGTGKRFPYERMDDENDEKREQCIALNLFKFEIPNDFTDSPRLHDD